MTSPRLRVYGIRESDSDSWQWAYISPLLGLRVMPAWSDAVQSAVADVQLLCRIDAGVKRLREATGI